MIGNHQNYGRLTTLTKPDRPILEVMKAHIYIGQCHREQFNLLVDAALWPIGIRQISI